jgi:hypothetical protein
VRLRRLQPVAVRRGFRITLAALLLPAIGIVLLAQLDPVRRPLAEEEATLAVAIRPVGESAERSPPAVPILEVPSRFAVTLASLGPKLLGSGELPLRFAGLIAGALALGATVRLGERLFATRVGVIAAALLLAAPEGRALLGTRLSVAPFFLLAMLVSLTGIRDLARARRSGVHASVAAGVAIGLVGAAALWLPVLMLLWLRRLRGLDRQSAVVVFGWSAAGLLVAGVAAILVVGWSPIAAAGFGSLAVAEELSSVGMALALLPILPLAAIGVLHLPPRWAHSESLRFIAWWFTTAMVSSAFTGSLVGPGIAALFFASALAAWALDRAGRGLRFGGAVAAVGLLLAVHGVLDRSEALEPWAARETARFVARVLPSERTIAAAEGAARRIAYYSRRDVAALPSPLDLGAVDYAVVDRRTLEQLGGRISADGREVRFATISLRVIAEFGPWLVARIQGPPNAPGSPPQEAAYELERHVAQPLNP